MNHQTFNNLADEELQAGLKLCLDNSNRHYRSAEALEKINEFPIANSHLILSVEEAIKGVILLSKLLGIKTDFDVGPYFKKHQKKHQAAKNILWDFKNLDKINEEVLTDLKSRKKDFFEKKDGKFVFNETLLKREYLRERELKTQKHKVKTNWKTEQPEYKWWDKANQNKDKGFYVNYINKRWEDPKELTKEMYFEGKTYVNNILGTFKKIAGNSDFTYMKEIINIQAMETIELKNTAPNGMAIDRINLTEIPNLDGSGIDYKIEYIDFINNEKTLVGTCDVIMGNIDFKESKGNGIPYSAIKLLVEWIDKKVKETEIEMGI